jgi:hypothetical protein
MSKCELIALNLDF